MLRFDFWIFHRLERQAAYIGSRIEENTALLLHPFLIG